MTTITGKFRVPASGATVPVRVGDITLELPEPPTADELSKPGALQSYIDASNGDPVQLPPGVIKANVVIGKDSTIVRGSGSPYGDRRTGTIITPADPAKPAVAIRDALAVTLADFGIFDAPIGVSLEGSEGALVFHTKLDSLAIVRSKVGVRVSEPPGVRKGQHTAADTVISHCRFTACETGVQLNHTQAVNVHVQDQCYFYGVGTAVEVNSGGRVLIADSCANPVGVWLRVRSGGGNHMPYVLRNLYSDRSGGAVMPVLIEASEVQGSFIATIDGYSMSYQVALDGPFADCKHAHFIPPASKWAKDNAKFIVGPGWNAAGSIIPGAN